MKKWKATSHSNSHFNWMIKK